VGLGALLERAWSGIAGAVRPPSAADLFRRADRLRHEGHYEEAERLVAEGLRRSPNSAAGHVLAAYLHLALREPGPAREAFERARSLDPEHPRALLGLARLAIEEGNPEAARPYLERALQYHADFPEAGALQEMIAGWTPPPAAASATGQPSVSGVPERLLPGGRDLILARADGSVVLAQCDADRKDQLASHITQVCRIASTTLARAGLGAVRRGAIEGVSETTYLQTDVGLVLAVALPNSVAPSAGIAELERLWTELTREG
jgi:tetratricopeptide (TPR) repeat protein